MVVAQGVLDSRAVPHDVSGVIVFMAVTVTLLTPPHLKFAFNGVLPHTREWMRFFTLDDSAALVMFEAWRKNSWIKD